MCKITVFYKVTGIQVMRIKWRNTFGQSKITGRKVLDENNFLIIAVFIFLILDYH